VRKLISSTSFQLKGSGWYLTDYARKDGGTKEKAPGGKAESAGDAKTESKSEAKSAGESPPSSKPSKGEGAQAA
jgi:predicted nucleic acid-binding Zn ribbon protein